MIVCSYDVIFSGGMGGVGELGHVCGVCGVGKENLSKQTTLGFQYKTLLLSKYILVFLIFKKNSWSFVSFSLVVK